ncbi:MAG: V-type ATPase 116kDa subunit family protein [Candidatus Auribacterota bacterium]|jgi:V/A-type H+-transporting ATPase subunit I|nr:V-type ATPase 116kDa subunit family protein [Candidatus Auribacterota bacterium]
MAKSGDMKQISIVVLNEDLANVNEAIIRHGCLHPFHAELMGDWANKLSGFYDTGMLQDMKDLRMRISSIARKINLDLKFDGATLDILKPQMKQLKPERVREEILLFESQLKSVTDHIRDIDNKLSARENVKQQLAVFRDVLDITKVSTYSVLDQFVGKLPNVRLADLSEKLKKMPHLVVPVKETPPWSVVIIYVFKKDRITVQKLLNEVSFQTVTLPEELKGAPHEVMDNLKKSFERLHEEKKSVTVRQTQIETQIKDKLPLYAYFVHFHTLLLESQYYFKKTARTCLITGWIPHEALPKLTCEIQSATGGRCFFESVDPIISPQTATSIPFRFKNISPIRPFELLIKLYGVPGYNTIDPTPFFALSMVFMFGYMFGDVGHGFILALLGLWLLLRKKSKTAVKQAGLLLTWCGCSSIVFGLLFGSVFGFETLIPALWIHPMHNIDTLLKIALFMGIGMITFGIVINIVNAVRTRNWVNAIFDKAGLIGGLLYWGMIGLTVHSYVLKHDIPGWMIFLFLGLPIITLFLKAPFEKLIGVRSHHEGGFFSYIMDIGFELVETIMGYVANTFSFIRVGAFALSHVGLFMAIFTLAQMVQTGTLATFKSTIVIVLGNILILLLEGMIVSIQTIRLEYYEFFSKFFTGDGLLYHPISIQDETH